jgi:hypothetical protein
MILFPITFFDDVIAYAIYLEVYVIAILFIDGDEIFYVAHYLRFVVENELDELLKLLLRGAL